VLPARIHGLMAVAMEFCSELFRQYTVQQGISKTKAIKKSERYSSF
jgi:hypothetical protein